MREHVNFRSATNKFKGNINYPALTENKFLHLLLARLHNHHIPKNNKIK